MQEEQAKRGPGRPRKAETRQHIDITISREAIEYMDSLYVSRSRFIETLITEHRKKNTK